MAEVWPAPEWNKRFIILPKSTLAQISQQLAPPLHLTMSEVFEADGAYKPNEKEVSTISELCFGKSQDNAACALPSRIRIGFELNVVVCRCSDR